MSRAQRLMLVLLLSQGALNTAQSQTPPDGQALYRQHCEVCHGREGRGGMGMPIGNPALLDIASREYILRTIEHGRPGRIMPAFGEHLSEAQIGAIADYIRQWSPNPAPNYKYFAIEGDPQRGAQLYQRNCRHCHGERGQGLQGTGVSFSRSRDLPIMPTALANPGFQLAASDEMLISIISNGISGTPMPSFRKRGLNDTDIRDLVSYLRTLPEEQPPSSRQPLESPLIEMESPYNLTQTVENVIRAAKGMNFRLIRTQSLDEGLGEDAAQTPDRIAIYFCNFEFLYNALKIDPRVGVFLPCRITVYDDDGHIKVSTANPKRLSRLFNNEQLNEACDRMYDAYYSIMEEATL